MHKEKFCKALLKSLPMFKEKGWSLEVIFTDGPPQNSYWVEDVDNRKYVVNIATSALINKSTIQDYAQWVCSSILSAHLALWLLYTITVAEKEGKYVLYHR